MDEQTTTARYRTWLWEDAFLKFGFEDGDGDVRTRHVAGELTDAGYQCVVHIWGLHNEVIASLKTKEGDELIPCAGSEDRFGYDDPREYLPQEVIAFLDGVFPHLPPE